MKRRILCTLTVLLLVCGSAHGGEDKLIGLWESYEQHGNAPAAECLYKLVFHDDGTMVQEWWTGEVIVTRHRFLADHDQITVVNEDGQKWRIHYSLLPNGDLSVQMGQWNFKALLTKNHEKVPQGYGCQFQRLLPTR